MYQEDLYFSYYQYFFLSQLMENGQSLRFSTMRKPDQCA